ncbi:MAG: putative AAA+ superfamily ATPase [Planctomycetota bacterium]|jgi:predicted AAA+ superfamily ATPase
MHTLLGIPTLDDLHGHPKVGASWEGFMLDQIVTRLGAEPDELYFWSVHAGPELDLLIVRGKRRIGFEFKLTVAPKVTKSMHVAYDLLGLSKLYVVHAGEESFTLGKNIQALAAKRIWSDLPKLK